MALDVHLKRSGEEQWGFEMLGGTDEAPLRVGQLQQCSPAEKVGLQTGDIILTINEAEAIDMSHSNACRAVAECGDTLKLGVMRGLYDPVLDDQEPIFETYEPDDSVRPSDPTEVSFKVQQFIEQDPLLFLEPLEPSPLNTTFTESRSLTSSPFVVVEKPYRPFSTEPILEIPPLEDPIILNPDYKDQFGVSSDQLNPDELLGSYYKDVFDKAERGKYKLPISEQYDPEGKRMKIQLDIKNSFKYIQFNESIRTNVTSRNNDTGIVTKTDDSKNISESKESKKISTSLTKETKTVSEEIPLNAKFNKYNIKKESCYEGIDEEMVREEIKYIEKMRQDIDLEKIEQTALTVVDESIEKAILVAEEIKKEIGDNSNENRNCESKLTVNKFEKNQEVEIVNENKKNEFNSQAYESNQRENIKCTSVDNNYEERKYNIEENILDRKENNETKVDQIHDSTIIRKEQKFIQESKNEAINFGDKQDYINPIFDGNEIKNKSAETEYTANKNDRSEAEQRVYSIGLQTIPNIKGVVHSSYHYDLLLKTFFIHLTDVMVALSRFLLTQPVFGTGHVDTHNVVRDTQKYDNKHLEKSSNQKEVQKKSYKEQNNVEIEGTQNKVESVQRKNVKEIIKNNQESIAHKIKQENTVNVKQSSKDMFEQAKYKNDSTPVYDNNTKVTESKRLSGSSMAQLSEKKLSQDLMHKMDAVVAEFETKASANCVDSLEVKKQIIERNRRSRSRSQVEEEVMSETDPLEWLDKVDSRRASQERTDFRKKELSFSASETVEKESCESKYESKQTKKSKPPKQMYRAIVEAHVYTNKDAILEEQVAELSETSSVQSADEINTAVEIIQIESSENVAFENAVKELNTAKVVVEESYLDVANSKNESAMEMVKAVEQNAKESIVYTKEEKALVKNEEQEVLVQEIKQVIEPVIDINKTKYEKVDFDINDTLSTTESHEINIHESNKELIKTEEIKKEATSLLEGDYNKTATKTELITDEFIEEHKTESNCKIVKPEYQIVEGEEISEKVVLKSDKEHAYKTSEASAELKILKELEIESQAEIIEIEDENELVKVGGVDALSVINKLQILKALEINESGTTDKSILRADFDSIYVNNAVKKETEESVIFSKNAEEIKASTKASLFVEQASASTEFESKSSEASEKISEYVLKQPELTKVAESLSEINNQENIQESSFKAEIADKKLTLNTEAALSRQVSVQNDENNIDTPTPSTVPPTPLVDEYVFKLTIPLPKSRGSTPVPRDCTPEDEDPHIVKKKLIPHIETSIERVVYDPPLPTPPGSKVHSPVYIKPGLRGGSDRPYYTKNIKEEMREIERKSSLLASAIDETIKSIEEYKEEVGITTKKELRYEEFKFEKANKSSRNSFNEDIIVQNDISKIQSEVNKNLKKSIDIEENFAENIGKHLPRNEETAEKVTAAEIVETNRSNNIKDVVNPEEKVLMEMTYTPNIDKVRLREHGNTLAIMVNETKVATDQRETDTGSKEKSKTISSIINKDNSDSEISKNMKVIENIENSDSLPGFKPVVFDPEAIHKRESAYVEVPVLELNQPSQTGRQSPYITETGEQIGTIQGIVDGLEEAVIDPEVAKELGKPGIPEDKIAELISGESEMLREAHVMGLSRVLNSHMHRVDDSSVDFQKIKPMIDSLKDSEVLKALNEELAKQKEEQKKKEEKKWTKFLQKPKRPVPKAKFGYHGWTAPEQQIVEEPYKVKIVKQPKPKVAPDYKPEDFDTGPLPWEERQLIEEPLPSIEPEEPILVPEESPEFLEAVDPLPESEVPDLEDTGIPLPPVELKEPSPPPIITEEAAPGDPEETEQEEVVEEKEDNTEEKTEEMENGLAEQLVRSVQSMVDPNASLEQQLAQMRAQLAALAQLPEVIQQTLELVTRQLTQIGQKEARVEVSESQEQENYQHVEEHQTLQETQEVQNESQPSENKSHLNGHQEDEDKMTIDEMTEQRVPRQQHIQSENEHVAAQVMMEQERLEKQKKNAQQPTQNPNNQRPRACKPQPKFGPLSPEQRAVVLPGGRRWRKTEDVYNEQLIAEILTAQSELIQGKVLGESNCHLVDFHKLRDTMVTAYNKLIETIGRINFMKYEKPPVSLDHLQQSEVYKLVHNMDQEPVKRVAMRTPVMSEADYRERCRSMTPSVKHLDIPQQFHP